MQTARYVFKCLNYRNLLPIFIILLGLLAYSNSFKGSFVFDDIGQLVNNPQIRRLELAVFSPRPVLMISLAFNYTLWGMSPVGYHLVNLAIHIMAGLCLYGILRRTLLLPHFEFRFQNSAPLLAFVAASLWVVHPLQTGSVTYIIQRAESLMGLFYLFCLYCLIRGHASVMHRHRWYAACICSCALGMGTKEIMVTAPVMFFLYDRIFLSESLRRQIRDRWMLYVGLAATWIALAALMICTLHFHPRVSYAQPCSSPMCYALTQIQVISHYLKLCFLPWPLCLDYAWPLVKSPSEVVGSTFLVVPLVLLTLAALRLRPVLGYLGMWFFGILGPTSSFIPRPDVAFEHRMYLPLAAVVILTVLVAYTALESLTYHFSGSRRLFRLIAAGFLVVILAALTLLTLARNTDYTSQETIWRREIRINPTNPRAYNELAMAMIHQRRFSDAIDAAVGALWTQFYRYPLVLKNEGTQRSINREDVFSIPPTKDVRPYVLAHTYIGISMHCLGLFDTAIEHYRKALSADPSFCSARNNLALVFFIQDKNESALKELKKVLQYEPQNGDSHRIIGDVYTWQRKYPPALRRYEMAMRYNPDDTATLQALAWVLSTCEDKNLRDGKYAVKLATRAAKITKFRDPIVLDTLAAAYARLGRFDDAIQTARHAFNLMPKESNTEQRNAIIHRLTLYKRGVAFTRSPPQ